MTQTAGRPSVLVPPDDVDPAGDLLLLLETGQDGRPTQSLVRVSSKVLSLASTVFAAMMSPKFAEGQALLKAISPETPSISLPDDDSEAVIWVCKALQFEQDLTVDIKFSLLRKLAILSDKYDLVGALNPWSHAWLQRWPGSSHGIDSHAEILWISYALGNEAYFWRNSRSPMHLYTMEDLAAFQNESLIAMLPDRLLVGCPTLSFAFNDFSCSCRLTTRHLDCITMSRGAALLELQKTFQVIMAALLEHECKAARDHNRDRNYRACDHLTKIGYYFAQLSKSELGAIDQKLQKTSFATVVAKLSIFKEYWDGNVTRGSYSEHCSSPSIDIKQLTERAAKLANGELRGLCLNCVKHGRYTKENPDCRNSRRRTCEG